MTQEELGQKLERATGTKWSRATVSHAEQGWSEDPGRIRHFDVNEVAAFALVLRVPIPWFFLPPDAQPHGYPPSSSDDAWITPREDDCQVALTRGQLVSMLIPSPRQADDDDLYFPRLREEFSSFISAADDQRTDLFLNQLSSLLDEFKRNKS